MVDARRLCPAVLVGLTIICGTGECNTFISNRSNVYCSDADCLPLRISNMEYLVTTPSVYSLCTKGSRIAETVGANIETFFNQRCPTTIAGPEYNANDIDKACPRRSAVSSVRVIYTCLSATATTQTKYMAITSSAKEGYGFTITGTANGSRDSNSTTAGSQDSISTTSDDSNTMIRGTVAAAICTSLGALAITFIALCFWRRKLGKGCLPHRRAQDEEVLSPNFATDNTTAIEFGERVYENCHNRQKKTPENGTNEKKSHGDEPSQAVDFEDRSIEPNVLDMPCYLEVLPDDSNHDSVSPESRGVHSKEWKVQDEKDKDQQDNDHYSSSHDVTYFVLEQLPVESPNANRYKTTSATETVVGPEAGHRATAEPDAFVVSHGTDHVASQNDNLTNAENELYISYDDPGKPDG